MPANWYVAFMWSNYGQCRMKIIPRSRTIILLCIFANALLLLLAICKYHPSTHGHLLKAAYFDSMPRAVDDAPERFQSELGFWKRWAQEKLKHLL